MQPEQQNNNIVDVINSYARLGEEVCAALVRELKNTGLNDELAEKIRFELLEFSLERDPYSQQNSLSGKWYGSHKNLLGSILFHPDGSFFAEHDVIQAHPSKKGWFVEAVTAWGNSDGIKSEARLLPMPE